MNANVLNFLEKLPSVWRSRAEVEWVVDAMWTLAYLAGHHDMNITKRYVHPQEQTIRAAMERAREAKSGHNSGHTSENSDLERMPVSAPTL